MKETFEYPDPSDADFDTKFPDEDFEDQPTIVKLPKTPTPVVQSKRADDGLLDMWAPTSCRNWMKGPF
jgi:hypothetical protein